MKSSISVRTVLIDGEEFISLHDLRAAMNKDNRTLYDAAVMIRVGMEKGQSMKEIMATSICCFVLTSIGATPNLPGVSNEQIKKFCEAKNYNINI